MITSAGITFGGASYHAACFACTSKREGNERDNEVFLFQVRVVINRFHLNRKSLWLTVNHVVLIVMKVNMRKHCSRCQKGIVADVEYLEFEDKFWHKECFTCSKCQVNSDLRINKKIVLHLFVFF